MARQRVCAAVGSVARDRRGGRRAGAGLGLAVAAGVLALVAAGGSAGAAFDGQFAWPLEGTLKSVYWECRDACERWHRGIDLATPADDCTEGQDYPVLAARGGIATVDSSAGLGLHVSLDHDLGYTTRYGHLREALVANGTVVAAGEPLGYVGRTGVTSVCHVHFEVRQRGTGDAFEVQQFVPADAGTVGQALHAGEPIPYRSRAVRLLDDTDLLDGPGLAEVPGQGNRTIARSAAGTVYVAFASWRGADGAPWTALYADGRVLWAREDAAAPAGGTARRVTNDGLLNVRAAPDRTSADLGDVYGAQEYVPVEEVVNATGSRWARIPYHGADGGSGGWIAAGNTTTVPYGAGTTWRDCPLAATVEALVGCVEAQMPGRGSAPGHGTGGYVAATSEDLAAWRSVVRAMLDGACGALPEALAGAYAQRVLADPAGEACVLLEAADADADGVVDRGWGTLVTRRAEPHREVDVLVAHPIADQATGAQGASVFARTGARTLLLAGAHRYASDDHPDTCQPGSYAADAAHCTATPFQAAVEELAAHRDARGVRFAAIEFHGNDDAPCPDVYLTGGVDAPPPAGDRLRALQAALRAARPAWTVELPGEGGCGLHGSTNVQGRLLNGVPAEAVLGTAATAATGRFVHAEQHLGTRDAAAWAEAINATWPTTVRLRTPAPGAVLRGTVDVAWDGGAAPFDLAAAPGPDAGFAPVAAGLGERAAAWDTLGGADGAAYRLRVGDGWSQAVVAPLTVDNTPPELVVTAPGDGAAYVHGEPLPLPAPLPRTVVAGDVVVRADATDATSGMDRVEAWVDGVLLGSDGAAPYAVPWPASSAPAGEHALRVVAYDVAGNAADAAQAVLTVPTTPEGLVASLPAAGLGWALPLLVRARRAR